MLANDVYSCDSGYLDLTAGRATCVAREKCTGLLFESKRLCVIESLCDGLRSILNDVGYPYSSSAGKECVTAADCRKKGAHAYLNAKQCSDLEPNFSSGNVVIQYNYGYVYACKTGTIMFMADKAQCLSLKECNYGPPKGFMSKN